MRAKWTASIILLIFLVIVPVSARQSTTQTFTSPDETFTFGYPADWDVWIAQSDLPSAYILIRVHSLPIENNLPDEIRFILEFPSKWYETYYNSIKTPHDLILGQLTPPPLAFIGQVTPSADGTYHVPTMPPPDIRDFMVDGNLASYAYRIPDSAPEASSFIFVADLGNDFWVQGSADSPSGGLPVLESYESAILTLIQSMRYTPPPVVFSGNPDLPQVYSGVIGVLQRGSIEFDYPADWYAFNPLGTLIIANHKDNVLLTPSPQPGEFTALVNGVAETTVSVDANQLLQACSAPKSDLTARTLVEQILGNLSPTWLEQIKEAGISVNEPEVTTVNGKEIVYWRQYQNDIEALILYIDLGKGYILSINATALKGELAQFEPQLFAVAGTMEYTPIPCDQQATATPNP